jgi:hypothetical protein
VINVRSALHRHAAPTRGRRTVIKAGVWRCAPPTSAQRLPRVPPDVSRRSERLSSRPGASPVPALVAAHLQSTVGRPPHPPRSRCAPPDGRSRNPPVRHRQANFQTGTRPSSAPNGPNISGEDRLERRSASSQSPPEDGRPGRPASTCCQWTSSGYVHRSRCIADSAMAVAVS